MFPRALAEGQRIPSILGTPRDDTGFVSASGNASRPVAKSQRSVKYFHPQDSPSGAAPPQLDAFGFPGESEWIGAYVSCTGTDVLEQAVQVARHIRCMVLRSTTDGGWLLKGKFGRRAVARFVQCAIWGLYWHVPSTIRAYAHPCRTSSEARGRCTASYALADVAYQIIPRSMTSLNDPEAFKGFREPRPLYFFSFVRHAYQSSVLRSRET